MQESNNNDSIEQELPFHLRVADRLNDRYRNFASEKSITIRKNKTLNESDLVFTMGSCFAEEIRTALTAEGITCLPEYSRIAFDPSVVVIDTLPRIEHMNFYNTFTVLQQFMEIYGQISRDEDDYWTIGRASSKVVPWADVPNYQDPYRRLVIARTPALLRDAVDQIVAEMRRSFERATAFVFTFGMTEVFVNRRSGRVVNQKPAYGGGGGLDETERYDSTFSDNLENVRKLVELIHSRKPDVPIFVSVSPVPLERTFTGDDVVSRSLEGKSILRAVLGQVSREFGNVHYLPSYEYVMMLGAKGYRDDLRHVLKPVVREIVRAFIEAYVEKQPALHAVEAV